MNKTFALALSLVPQLALASPRLAAVCTGGEVRCHVHVVLDDAGRIRADATTPSGYGAPDLESAYGISPSNQQAATVAIVDAFGYPTLESDLAVYRKQYGLPACTVANGCLKIVNQNGQTSPLPPLPTPSYDWTMETALDVDMASAACPGCKIIVVQTTDSTGGNLFDGLFEAVALAPDVVSNSWGIQESTLDSISDAETAMAGNAGIAVFASTGDSGYDTGGMGPQYPSTSAHVIAVGGTVLSTASNARGYSEVAWPMAGSSCSTGVPKLASQTSTACAYRAAADLSAIAGDPGVAVYDTHEGGWITLEGTSAATPLVAAMFAAAGLGATTTPDTIAQLAGTLTDVTSGTNGTCGSALCKAGPGWDGPTGYGTPNAAALTGGGGSSPTGDESVNVTSPISGDTVAPGFSISIDVVGPLTVSVSIDHVAIGTKSTAPFDFATPASLAAGPHEIEVLAQDPDGNTGSATIDVTVADTGNPATGGGGEIDGGCAAGGGGGLLGVALIGLVGLRRRRR